MKNADYWDVFELTGNINDYLNYACASELKQEISKEESGNANESGDSIRDSFVLYANRRI